MSSRNSDEAVRDSVLEAFELSLEAQLRAIRRLRTSVEEPLELKEYVADRHGI